MKITRREGLLGLLFAPIAAAVKPAPAAPPVDYGPLVESDCSIEVDTGQNILLVDASDDILEPGRQIGRHHAALKGQFVMLDSNGQVIPWDGQGAVLGVGL